MLLEQWHTPVVVEEPQAELGAASSKSDPGPATDHQLSGPLLIRKHRVVDRAEYSRFLEAIRSQGHADIRQSAISLLLERARQDRGIDARAYRVLEQVCSRARWAYRYHCETLALAAHFTAGDASNLHRDIKPLVEDGRYLARVRIRREGGGKPISYLTPICTAQDRSGETRTLLDRAARASTGEQPIRHDDDLQNVTLTDCEDAKPSALRFANRHSDEHIVDSHCREKKEHLDRDKLTSRDDDGKWLQALTAPSFLDDIALAIGADKRETAVWLAGLVRQAKSTRHVYEAVGRAMPRIKDGRAGGPSAKNRAYIEMSIFGQAGRKQRCGQNAIGDYALSLVSCVQRRSD